MPEATDRRERFVLACLKAGAAPDKALAQARAMEEFVVAGTVAPLMLAPPPEPASEPEPKPPVDKTEPVSDSVASAGAQPAPKPEPAPEPAKPAHTAPPVKRPRGGNGRGLLPTGKVAEFSAMWKESVSTEKMAVHFGMNRSTVYLWARRLKLGRRIIKRGHKFAPAGGKARRAEAAAPASRSRAEGKPAAKIVHGSTWTTEKVAEFKRMWRAGADTSDIAAKFNLAKGSVKVRASTLGLGGRGPKGEKRAATPAPARTPTPDQSIAAPAMAAPAPRPQQSPLPDTSGLAPLPKPTGAEQTDIEGVIRFLMSRDIHLEKANIGKTPRWMLEGHRDKVLTAAQLIIYANAERRRIGRPELVYGL